MNKSAKMCVIGFVISVLFLIISVDYIPLIIAWLPLVVMVYLSSKCRSFRDWAVRFINNSFE